jgi:hypothetical protein
MSRLRGASVTDDREMLMMCKPAPLVCGERGEELRKGVWSEIVEALGKDVPKLKEVPRMLESF